MNRPIPPNLNCELTDLNIFRAVAEGGAGDGRGGEGSDGVRQVGNDGGGPGGVHGG